MGNNINFSRRLPEEDKSEINILARKKPVEVKCYEQNKGTALKRPNITIGVLGESHRGKSSFINTARNLKPGDLDAAAVKNQECTMEPAFYDLPDNPKVKLVDLPGVGTNRFQKSNYIEEIEFTK